MHFGLSCLGTTCLVLLGGPDSMFVFLYVVFARRLLRLEAQVAIFVFAWFVLLGISCRGRISHCWSICLKAEMRLTDVCLQSIFQTMRALGGRRLVRRKRAMYILHKQVQQCQD